MTANHLRVALVTAFPPGRGDLNEYGYHLACALRDHASVELVVLADDSEASADSAGFNMKHCWRFNSALSVFRVLGAIREVRPDVVWFNMGFSTFASSPLLASFSITLPLLVRLMGYYTHITLHTIFERINLLDAGVRHPALYRAAGRVATQLLLLSGDVSVLMPSFRSELLKSYRATPDRIHFRPHGTFSGTNISASVRPVSSEQVILAFGYWGTYKKLDLLLQAMEEIVRQVPYAVLEIAGTNHPNTPAYLESLAERCQGRAEVRFLGYVAEEDLPALFARARVLVLPYSSAAGTSGVVRQACQYGLPLVAAEIPEFVEMAEEERIAIEFYPQGDNHALAQHLIRYLESDELCRRSSHQNLEAAQRMPLADVVDDYVQHFQQRLQDSRFKE